MPAPGGGMIAVERISGRSRYDADLAAAEAPAMSYVGPVGGKKTALLARGLNVPDAPAGGALAYGAALPILLTDPLGAVAPGRRGRPRSWHPAGRRPLRDVGRECCGQSKPVCWASAPCGSPAGVRCV